MQKHLYCCILFTALFSLAFGQSSNCDTLFWKANRKLTWTDFKGRPDTLSPFSAMTIPSIGYIASQSGDTVRVWTYSGFLTCKSWTKHNSSTLLQHEQTHFDIMEYCRRKFIRKLATTSFKGQDVQTAIEALHKEAKRLREELTHRYDLETDFSKKKAQQDRWSADIALKIKQLDKWSISRVVILSK